MIWYIYIHCERIPLIKLINTFITSDIYLFFLSLPPSLHSILPSFRPFFFPSFFFLWEHLSKTLLSNLVNKLYITHNLLVLQLKNFHFYQPLSISFNLILSGNHFSTLFLWVQLLVLVNSTYKWIPWDICFSLSGLIRLV